MTISTFRWNESKFKEFLTLILEKQTTNKDKNKTVIYSLNQDAKWSKVGGSKFPRTVKSIFLAKGQLEKIITDIRSFIDSREWYETRNIPHRRGYLLYGPPGCGKTSMIRAIAGEFKQDICALSLCAKGLTDDLLLTNINGTPSKRSSIILIEDIDCAFNSRTEETSSNLDTNITLSGGSGSLVTFRGLLNALDGVGSCDGRLVFLTTNHPEKLDPALTRPGRIDVKIFVDYPTEEQLERFFTQFYPEASEETKLEFLENLRGLEQKVSMAMIQGLFLLYKENAQEAVSGFSAYFEEQFKILPKVRDVNSNMYT